MGRYSSGDQYIQISKADLRIVSIVKQLVRHITFSLAKVINYIRSMLFADYKQTAKLLFKMRLK